MSCSDFCCNHELTPEWNNKLERLDDLFLFTISTIGLLFTIIQVLTIGIVGFIEISPILLLGVGLPVYVGYVRGAIEYGDIITERLRGWVYLVIGITAFAAFFLLRYGSLGILFYSFFLLLAFLLGYSLERWFNTVFCAQKNIANLYAFSSTIIAGISLAYFLAYSVILYLTYLTTLQFSSLTLALINLAVLTLMIFIVLEATSRRLHSLKLPISERQAEKRHRQFFLIRVLLCAVEVLLLALRQNAKIINLFITGLLFYLISIFALLVELAFQSEIAALVYGALSVTSMLFLLTVAAMAIKSKEINTNRFILLSRQKRVIE